MFIYINKARTSIFHMYIRLFDYLDLIWFLASRHDAEGPVYDDRW